MTSSEEQAASRRPSPEKIRLAHNVLVVEDAVGFVVEYRVVAKGVLDQDLVVPVMRELQERFGGGSVENPLFQLKSRTLQLPACI